MIRLVSVALAAILSGTIVLTTLAAVDPSPDQPEPPARLKKKNKPLPDAPAPDNPEPKPAPGKEPDQPGKVKIGEDPVDPPDEEEDPQEILGRIAANMRNSEERLANKELGDKTVQVQRDALKDLDALIERQKQQQQQQESASSESTPQGGGSKEQKRQMARNNSGAKPQGQRKPGKGQGSKPTPGQDKQPGQGTQPGDNIAKNNGNGGIKPGNGSGGDSQDPNKLADVYKDIWGHLPESKRAEMDAYAREKFMAKYNDLIKQYYSTLSEKSRRKGD